MPQMNGNGYREAIQDDESLALFLRSMKKFDQRFCDAMASGEDFTLRMEVHGNKGVLIHVRVQDDGFERPKVGSDVTSPRRLVTNDRR